jgi:hypothetical protein
MVNPKRSHLAKNPAKRSITLIKQRLKPESSDDEVCMYYEYLIIYPLDYFPKDPETR